MVLIEETRREYGSGGENGENGWGCGCAAHVMLLLMAVPLFALATWAAQEASAAKPEAGQAKPEAAAAKPAEAPAPTGDYVGAETCSACHADEAKQFGKTAMAAILSNKYPVEQRGCEACHGPGRKHVDAVSGGEGEPAKLIYNPARHSAKENAARCLTCHQKDEARSLFHRSQHLSAKVGCTDCHDPHLMPESAQPVKPDQALPAYFRFLTFPGKGMAGQSPAPPEAALPVLFVPSGSPGRVSTPSAASRQ